MQRINSGFQTLQLHSSIKGFLIPRIDSALGADKWGRVFSTSSAQEDEEVEKDEKIVAAVVFERLPVILPKLDPELAKFQEFAFQWQNQYCRQYPDEFLKKTTTKEQGNNQKIDFKPAPRVTEADKSNDRRSLQRALDRRLYLILHGTPYGASKDKPVWHFPEKLYTDEETMRKCAESALKSVIGNLSDVYFVGNAPCGHLIVPDERSGNEDSSYFKRFFFKAQVIGDQKSYPVSKCDDYVWVSKDELLEYFDESKQIYLRKMLIH